MSVSGSSSGEFVFEEGMLVGEEAIAFCSRSNIMVCDSFQTIVESLFAVQNTTFSNINLLFPAVVEVTVPPKAKGPEEGEASVVSLQLPFGDDPLVHANTICLEYGIDDCHHFEEALHQVVREKESDIWAQLKKQLRLLADVSPSIHQLYLTEITWHSSLQSINEFSLDGDATDSDNEKEQTDLGLESEDDVGKSHLKKSEGATSPPIDHISSKAAPSDVEPAAVVTFLLEGADTSLLDSFLWSFGSLFSDQIGNIHWHLHLSDLFHTPKHMPRSFPFGFGAFDSLALGAVSDQWNPPCFSFSYASNIHSSVGRRRIPCVSFVDSPDLVDLAELDDAMKRKTLEQALLLWKETGVTLVTLRPLRSGLFIFDERVSIPSAGISATIFRISPTAAVEQWSLHEYWGLISGRGEGRMTSDTRVALLDGKEHDSACDGRVMHCQKSGYWDTLFTTLFPSHTISHLSE